MGSRRRYGTRRPARAQLGEKFLGRQEKRILLQDTADDDHGMGAHEIDHDISAEFREIVGADDRILVVQPHGIDTRFELDDLVDVTARIDRPFHVADDAAEWESTLRVPTGQALENAQHPLLVELAVAQIGVGVDAELELTDALGAAQVDPRRRQALPMRVGLMGIHHVDGFVTALESLLDEGHQDAILLLLTVEERTDMPGLGESRTGEADRGRGLHAVSPNLTPAMETIHSTSGAD